MFVGILWMRFGTPSGGQDLTTGRYYDSGTEEEFYLAYRAWKAAKRPRILFYHRTSGVESLNDIDLEQLSKVRAFCKEFGAAGQHPGLVQTYQTPIELERRVRNDLLGLLPVLSTQASVNRASGALKGYEEELSDVERRLDLGEMAPSVPPIGSSPGPFRVPALPVEGVFGRELDLDKIQSELALDDPSARGVPPLALVGMAGVGKSVLARAVGWRDGVRELYPDGILWAELGPKPNVRILLNEWGRELKVDLIPERDESACRTRLSEALYDKRVLLIVDDVWDPKAGSYFLVGGPYCRTLITTRERPIAYTLATQPRSMPVNILSLEASLELLSSLAPVAVKTDPQVARQLCVQLERLPLALKLAGRLLAVESYNRTRVQQVLHDLVEQRKARLKLLQDEGRLGLDEENPVSLQAILGISVERLTSVEQDRFAMLAVFGSEPLTWDINAAASVWECTVDEARKTTGVLVNRGLIECSSSDCSTDDYVMHALLADYSAVLMEVKGL
ncbi:MAG TPA: NB-ARC domain-containing protein [Chloroflexia bacterium]